MTERLLTPSKITAFLDCAHYLTLEHRREEGELLVDGKLGAFARLLMDKGLEHERACLAHYRAQARTVYEVPAKEQDESFAQWVARVGNPMAAGHDVIYQMPFVHDGVRGVADFLVRVVDGDGVRYEPVDAKLSRAEAKPGHVLQLCFYADAIEALTGTSPVDVHLWLGSGRIEHVRLAEVRAYWRRLRGQVARAMDPDPASGPTAPERCNHCQFCEFADVCDAEWREQDSLHFVAHILKADRTALSAAGHGTLAALAVAVDPVEGIRHERHGRLVTQASLQLRARDGAAGEAPPVVHLPVDLDGPPLGFRALPEPDAGDVFLDYEGHPFWRADTGLFFLFGLLTSAPDGTDVYEARWAHDRAGEAAATRQLIADLAARREQHPGMHVYHYNHTERSSLERLTVEHGVGQDALASLVDSGLFVDLLRVVTGAVQVGVESYGLKHVEVLTDFVRGHDIDQGAGAVVEYEHWCTDGDQERLDRIARYNEDDVRATRALRDWLLTQRPSDLPWRAAQVELPEPSGPDIDASVEALHAFGEGSAEHLLGDLLGYWRREARAVFGGLIAKTAYEEHAELQDPEVVAGLEFDELVPRHTKKGKLRASPAARFRFPPQVLGEKPLGSVIFAAGDGLIGFSEVLSIDAGAGLLELEWNKRCQELGVRPTSIVRNDWVAPRPKPEAVAELASRVLAEGGPAASPVTMALLRRELPAFVPGAGPANGRLTDDLDDLKTWVLGLHESFIAIQGPPGTGKTYTGAHLIHALVMTGKRVGITAMSHHAIGNLLDQVVDVFAEAGDTAHLRAVAKTHETRSKGTVTFTKSNEACDEPEWNLVAGTGWLFAREPMRDAPLDVLFIDEAGQLALADAVAVAPAARNLVLLGDPLQLAHVSQGTHPGGSGASVLAHVLGADTTIPAERGVFLHETWRMHPDVCAFISEEFYDGRLVSHLSCAVQRTSLGTGLRWISAVHEGCSTSSPVEAALVLEAATELIGGTWVDRLGVERPLVAADVMVVAPYNNQVAVIRRALSGHGATAAVQVGTVDKFQGREAPAVLFSMTASTAADVPRGLDFLFSRNRLNVALSRARGLATVVCTDALLDSRARSVGEMRLISTLCSLYERCVAPPST